MDQASKLVLYAGIITATIFILVLVQGKGNSGFFMLLLMVLALVLCHCYKDCRYASMLALFNLILAVNAFDIVGLIAIGSNTYLNAERLWGGSFTTYNIIAIFIFVGHAVLSYIGWLLYQEYSKLSPTVAGTFGQPVFFDNGNATGVVGGGQYDSW